eukprot:TRINITY_DN4524_c0_g1_i2.p1 TRINITY_DN4524_c0_g1~~TRINITY_DN4524_c0_g1_i2.p1  ORF type:complete len:478 (-),score=73.25 TRINITY_DN4524_c0_g1_i2:1161-2594(-)
MEKEVLIHEDWDCDNIPDTMVKGLAIGILDLASCPIKKNVYIRISWAEHPSHRLARTSIVSHEENPSFFERYIIERKREYYPCHILLIEIKKRKLALRNKVLGVTTLDISDIEDANEIQNLYFTDAEGYELELPTCLKVKVRQIEDVQSYYWSFPYSKFPGRGFPFDLKTDKQVYHVGDEVHVSLTLYISEEIQLDHALYFYIVVGQNVQWLDQDSLSLIHENKIEYYERGTTVFKKKKDRSHRILKIGEHKFETTFKIPEDTFLPCSEGTYHTSGTYIGFKEKSTPTHLTYSVRKSIQVIDPKPKLTISNNDMFLQEIAVEPIYYEYIGNKATVVLTSSTNTIYKYSSAQIVTISLTITNHSKKPLTRATFWLEEFERLFTVKKEGGTNYEYGNFMRHKLAQQKMTTNIGSDETAIHRLCIDLDFQKYFLSPTTVQHNFKIEHTMNLQVRWGTELGFKKRELFNLPFYVLATDEPN